MNKFRFDYFIVLFFVISSCNSHPDLIKLRDKEWTYHGYIHNFGYFKGEDDFDFGYANNDIKLLFIGDSMYFRNLKQKWSVSSMFDLNGQDSILTCNLLISSSGPMDIEYSVKYKMVRLSDKFLELHEIGSDNKVINKHLFTYGNVHSNEKGVKNYENFPSMLSGKWNMVHYKPIFRGDSLKFNHFIYRNNDELIFDKTGQVYYRHSDSHGKTVIDAGSWRLDKDVLKIKGLVFSLNGIQMKSETLNFKIYHLNVNFLTIKGFRISDGNKLMSCFFEKME